MFSLFAQAAKDAAKDTAKNAPKDGTFDMGTVWIIVAAVAVLIFLVFLFVFFSFVRLWIQACSPARTSASSA